MVTTWTRWICKKYGRILGRPQTATRGQVKEPIDQRIRDNQNISIDEIVFKMSISHGKTEFVQNVPISLTFQDFVYDPTEV
jgi:hypothetical protein